MPNEPLQHTLTLTHNREPIALTLSDAPIESTVDVESRSLDLTEAWRELLSRLPSDLYAALCVAMREAGRAP